MKKTFFIIKKLHRMWFCLDMLMDSFGKSKQTKSVKRGLYSQFSRFRLKYFEGKVFFFEN